MSFIEYNNTWWKDFDRKEEIVMEAVEKDKITEAMKLCESKIQSFFSYLDDTLDKGEASKFKDFIVANTFFAGGVFRSTLSGTPVNDIDIFFKSLSSAIEFKHMVMSQKVKLFKEVTPNGSYNFKPGKGPKISFTTRNYGHPDQVIKKFDLSFNQHYYDMQKMEMKFDRDTFNKAGVLNIDCMDTTGALARSIRFMNQGWKVDQTSIIEVLKAFWSKEEPFTLGSSGQGSPDKLSLIRKSYTEKDYFGRQPADKSKKQAAAKYLLSPGTGAGVWATSGGFSGEIPPVPPEIVQVLREAIQEDEPEEEEEETNAESIFG